MKILMAHNYYRSPGGEDAAFKSECELLSHFGEEVFLYERDNSELENLSNFEKFKHLYSLGFSKRTYYEIRALIKKNRPVVAHFHNIFYFITPAAYFACKDEGVPVVQIPAVAGPGIVLYGTMRRSPQRLGAGREDLSGVD